MIRLVMHLEDRHRVAEASPDAVIVDARRHHEDQDFVAVQLPGGHDFQLHGLFRRAKAFLPDGPGIHVLWNMAERRDFSHFVQVFDG